MVVCSFLYFFFFQAEDGIRDLIVTGVQTCALPISIRSPTCERRQQVGDRIVGAHIDEGRTTAILDDVRGGVSGIEVLGIDGADAVRVSIQSRLQGNVDLCAVSRMARRECTHRNLYARLRGMTHHRSPATALAMCAAAGVAVLCAPESRAQQPAPAHRERGTLVFENIPLPEAALMARLERYQQSRQASFLDWLPGGSLLIAPRFGGSAPPHRVAAPLGMREQLTFYEDPIEWARAPRRGSGFVFLKDQGGDENAQLYYHGGGGVRH